MAARTDTLTASLSFRWERERELVSSLRDGLESRITYTFRVYQKRGGFLPLLADRMLAEKTIARSAFWDFLDGRFVIENDGGSRTEYAGADDLLREFFSLTDVTLYRSVRGERSDWYVTARARFEPVRLMPPLTIVSLVGGTASYTTPWARRDAP